MFHFRNHKQANCDSKASLWNGYWTQSLGICYGGLAIYFQSWWVALKHKYPYIAEMRLATSSNIFFKLPKEMPVLPHGGEVGSGYRKQIVR